MPWKKTYIAIDLKSFYASQECMARGLDPLTTNLVVADASRTEKTICLAVSPSLKARGIPGRPRLFEVVQKVQEINALRRCHAPGGRFSGASWDDEALKKDPSLAVDYIVAEPHMAQYVACSTRVYEVYLKYVAPEDIHVYSIDEVFMDVTPYLKARGMTARDFAAAMIRDVQAATGITATAGIGPNLYLCKVAMDIVAKHVDPDRDGVRIARLDENSYRRLLWGHQPLTDFWRVGRGYAEKLEKNGLFTMGDIARCSLGGPNAVHNETLLYRLFGVNAELLIDHAWGRESCTMADVKAYRPQSSSLGSGQVLQCPYRFEQARLIVKEMTDQLALDLVDKGLVTDQITLTVGYDRESLQDPAIASRYHGEVGVDYYGRRVPRHAHGTASLGRMTSSARLMTEAMMNLFDRIVHPALLVRRVTVVAARVAEEQAAQAERGCEQLDFFTDYEAMQRRREAEDRMLAGEKRRQQAVLDIRRRFGKNAILLGMNLQEGGTTIQRNNQIGGHKA